MSAEWNYITFWFNTGGRESACWLNNKGRLCLTATLLMTYLGLLKQGTLLYANMFNEPPVVI